MAHRIRIMAMMPAAIFATATTAAASAGHTGILHTISPLFSGILLAGIGLFGLKIFQARRGRDDLDALKTRIEELESSNRAASSRSRDLEEKNAELEKTASKLGKINDIGRALPSVIESRELPRRLIEMAADLLKAEEITVHLRSEGKPPITMRYRNGKLEDPGDISFEFSGEYREIVLSDKPLLLVNGNGDPGGSYVIGVPLTIKGDSVGAMLLRKNEDLAPFTEADISLLSALSNHAMVALENAWLYESLKINYLATIQSLVNALEASDRFTKGHSERVRLLSVELGKHIGLETREIELLEQASILHDIGKIGIDNFILQKQGRLTAKEYSLIKTHPLIGDEILGPIGTLQSVRNMIIQHHERYDGNGYPYGLRGDEICLNSKILSVVDTFDAMMTDRPYRKALTLQKVKEELRINSGTQFDPYVVESFAGMLDEKGHELLTAAGYNSLYSV